MASAKSQRGHRGAVRKTPELVERARQLFAAGESFAAIARACGGADPTTVRRWLGQETPRDPVGRKRQARSAAIADAGRLIEAADESTRVAVSPETEAAVLNGGLDALRAYYAWLGPVLVQQMRMIATGTPGAPTNTQYRSLADHAANVAVKIAELTPPEPEDPNDASHVQANEGVLLQRLRSMMGKL